MVYTIFGKKNFNLTGRAAVRFEPQVSASNAHHVVIFGCPTLGLKKRHIDSDYVWSCESGQLEREPEGSMYDTGRVCGRGISSIVYSLEPASALDLAFPEEAGMKIGGDSYINYLVMQVHYKPHEHSGQSHSHTDSSGVIIHTVSGHNHGITKLAGIFTFFSTRPVPIGPSHQTVGRYINENIVIHPFRYRPHTHDLGVKVRAYMFPGGDLTKPILIGEADPQEPQVYLPVKNDSLTVGKGDLIMSRCEYNNTRNKTVFWGLRHEDEMCVLYLMYWTDSGKLLRWSF